MSLGGSASLGSSGSGSGAPSASSHIPPALSNEQFKKIKSILSMESLISTVVRQAIGACSQQTGPAKLSLGGDNKAWEARVGSLFSMHPLLLEQIREKYIQNNEASEVSRVIVRGLSEPEWLQEVDQGQITLTPDEEIQLMATGSTLSAGAPAFTPGLLGNAPVPSQGEAPLTAKQLGQLPPKSKRFSVRVVPSEASIKTPVAPIFPDKIAPREFPGMYESDEQAWYLPRGEMESSLMMRDLYQMTLNGDPTGEWMLGMNLYHKYKSSPAPPIGMTVAVGFIKDASTKGIGMASHMLGDLQCLGLLDGEQDETENLRRSLPYYDLAVSQGGAWKDNENSIKRAAYVRSMLAPK